MPRSKTAVLSELRKHKHFAVLVETIKVDLDEWRTNDANSEEEYPGEAAERAESYDLLVERLTGKRA
jgi:hypothetical protein